MQQVSVPKLSTNTFTAELSMQDDAALLKVTGSADLLVMHSLDAMLKQLAEQLKQVRVREVVVDMRELEFMNSSCFKSFVTWLTDVQQLERDKQYQIRFLSDSSKHWQRRSLFALSCFAVDLVKIES